MKREPRDAQSVHSKTARWPATQQNPRIHDIGADMPCYMHPMTRWISALLVTTLLAASATAAKMEAPLALETDTDHAEVGDVILLTISTARDETQPQWAGQGVHLAFEYDMNEDRFTTNPEGQTAWTRESIVTDIGLNDDATATYAWTVPQNLQDRNVMLLVVSATDEVLTYRLLPVGNPEPIMLASSTSSGPNEPVPNQETAEENEQVYETQTDIPNPKAPTKNAVPMIGALGLVGAVVAVAAMHARRHR